MVAGAWYYRYGRDGGGGDPNPFTPDEPVQIICASDLDTGQAGTTVCDLLADAGVEVTVEDAAETAERLGGTARVEADAWLVAAPWPQIVNENRCRAGSSASFEDAGEPIERSPVVLAMWQERAAALAPRCRRDTVDWGCIGEVAGRSWGDVGGMPGWGRVKPSHDHPQRGAGLVVLGAVAANRLGKTDFNTNDFNGDSFVGWFPQLEREISFGGRSLPIRDMVSFGPSRYDAVGTLEAFAAPIADNARGGELELLYPKPLVTADIVLAPLVGGDADRARDIVQEVAPEALARSGWRVQGQPAAEGIPSQPALPAAGEAPSPGALEALRLRWEQET